jgi:hypothetical protein
MFWERGNFLFYEISDSPIQHAGLGCDESNHFCILTATFHTMQAGILRVQGTYVYNVYMASQVLLESSFINVNPV